MNLEKAPAPQAPSAQEEAGAVPGNEAAAERALLNRELGLLEFNRRVLAQAQDAEVPLLERLRFLCITGSNLDEFFEIRVAGLKAQADLGAEGIGPDGLHRARCSRRYRARPTN